MKNKKFYDDSSFLQEKSNFPNSIKYSFRTKKGYQITNPNKVNQDNFIAYPNYAQNPFQHLFAVCDGHGVNGHFVSYFIKQEFPS